MDSTTVAGAERCLRYFLLLVLTTDYLPVVLSLCLYDISLLWWRIAEVDQRDGRACHGQLHRL